jgi:uncharacterized ferredoxin-like protein
MRTILLTAAVPLLLGPLTFVVMQQLKLLSKVVDNLPVTAKRFAVAAIAVLLTGVSKASGVELACDANAVESCLTTLDQDAVRAALAAGVAYVLHLAKKKPTPDA